MSKDPQQVQKQFQVQSILDRRVGPDDRFQYFVKWEGFSKEQGTWQPLNNLIGSEAVQHLVEQINKKLDSKSKNNWNNDLRKWINPKRNIKNNEQFQTNACVKEQKLNKTFYQDPEVIDIQSNSSSRSKREGVKKKQTIESQQCYPCQTFKSMKHPYLGKRVEQIKRIQTIDNQTKCLVKWKSSTNDQTWVLTDIMRIIDPEKLLQMYEKVTPQ